MATIDRMTVNGSSYDLKDRQNRADLLGLENVLRNPGIVTLANASIEPAGNVVQYSGRNVYIIPVGTENRVVVLSGELYALYSEIPAIGGQAVQQRTMMSGRTEIEIPAGVNFVGVRDVPGAVPTVIYPDRNKKNLANIVLTGASIEPAGNIVEFSNRNLYCAYVGGMSSCYVSAGDLYAFFADVPKVGAISLDHRTSLTGWAEVQIPTGANYIAVRAENPIAVTANRGNVWIVDQQGNGDCTTVAEAVRMAYDGDVVEVMPGNYTGEIIEAFGKTVHIIGTDKQAVVISNDLDAYETPPIEMAVGSLQNVTVIANRNSETAKGAYAMHVEDNFEFGKTFTVRNCVFKSASGASVGMGMRGNYSVLFEDCDFIATDFIANFGSSGYAFYFHDTVEPTLVGQDTVAIRNCRFYGLHSAGVVMRVDSEGLDGSSVTVEFIGNSFVNPNNDGSQSYVSAHNNGGTDGADWIGLKNFHLNPLSFGNQRGQFNA